MPLCNRVGSDTQQVYPVCAERQTQTIRIEWSLSYMAGDGKKCSFGKEKTTESGRSRKEHNRKRFFVSLNCLFLKTSNF